VKQQSGETRLNLLKRNAAIVQEIVDDIVSQNSRAIMIITTNPVDILTYFAYKRSGWSRSRVIGSGTVLDSARFRFLLSQSCNVDIHNIHAIS
jgi:L-lactate dehydrogenase